MTGAKATERLFLENLKSAELVAGRLSSSLNKVAALFPISGKDIEHLNDQAQESLDAFLKRFEQLQDIIENKLFRGVALLEREDIAAMSKRDLTNLMEKLGALHSADEWAILSILRNKLAHEYPGDPGRQAQRLNQAFDWSGRLIEAVDRIKKHVMAKGLIQGLVQ